MLTCPREEPETRRIILFRVSREGNPEILLGRDGTHRTLPQLQTARRQRVAEQLIAEVKKQYDLDVVSAYSLEPLAAESDPEQIFYEIMEPHEPGDEAPHGQSWVTVDSLNENGFRNGNDFHAVQRAVAKSIAFGEERSSGPFARMGWFRELEHWVRTEIGPRGLRLNGRFRQLNAGSTFSLIRFETEGPAIWFKAIGLSSRREFALTIALAGHFPSFLAEIIAMRAEWNGWLALEAPGSLLRDCYAISKWKSAAQDLAELQIHSLGTGQSLLDSGARDLRTSALANLVEPVFQAMGELMERQTKMPPSRLSRAQLRVLATRVGDAIAVLQETGIPNTLGHLDPNPGNIICSSAGCVFLDWAEAFVGHPFLTFEYLLEHFRRRFGQSHSKENQLIRCYTSAWRSSASEGDILGALNVAPLVAVFAYTVGNDVWNDPRKLDDSNTAGHLRGLARRIEREVQALAERRTACQS